ncbi:hypothetical protein SDC9_161032 [bioreactor metagenome]|uniref:Uncharacterized protein n=1 Tax=bioreactor metagenome TaxID=1076179 RepID=A0A645FH39_9ZZZZ
MLVKHQYLGIAGFLIGSNGHDGFFIIGNRIVFTFCPFFIELNGREQVLYLLLHLIQIKVSYDDDALEVSTIPLMVIGSYLFRLEVVDHVNATDRHPIGIFTVGVHFREQLIP